jgi:imidazolonepropionase-like amidohydrolase
VAREVAALVRYGLPPEAALAAATSEGHALLGTRPPRAGEPARLVTFERDPRADPTELAHPAAVLTAPRGRP